MVALASHLCFDLELYQLGPGTGDRIAEFKQQVVCRLLEQRTKCKSSVPSFLIGQGKEATLDYERLAIARVSRVRQGLLTLFKHFRRR